MVKFSKSAIRALFAATLFLGAAPTPAHAQCGLIAAGAGSIVGNDQQTRFLAFWVADFHGVVRGESWGYEPATYAYVRMDITSYMYLGNDLAVAGPVTASVNAPPAFLIGATAFMVFHDNGRGRNAGDSITGTSVVPPSYGNLTIQQVIALIGSGPPPQAFLPLLSGGITKVKELQAASRTARDHPSDPPPANPPRRISPKARLTGHPSSRRMR